MQSVVFSTVSSTLVNMQRNPQDKNNRQTALLVEMGAMDYFQWVDPYLETSVDPLILVEKWHYTGMKITHLSAKFVVSEPK